MKKKIKLLEKTTEAVNVIIFLVGIIFTLLGSFVFKEESGILISIGCSLIASSVVGYLTSRYAIKRAEVKEIIDTWGMVSIYESRQIMNIECDKSLEEMGKTLDIVAFGLKSFRDSKDTFIKEKVKKGLKIRILTMNPNSKFCNQRDIEEKDTIGHTSDTIFKLGEWIKELQQIAPDENNIQIKYYDSMTQDFYFCIDQKDLYMGPYLYGKGSQQTVSYQYKKGEMINYYSEYFNSLWNDDEFAKKL